MTTERVKIGAFDASPGKKDPKETWVSNLTEQLNERGALHILDARTQPLPDLFQARLTHEDISAFTSWMDTTFSPAWKKNLQGKTLVMAYQKFGHGHKHQALDMATVLAQTTNSRVIVFDPMDALVDREREMMIHKKNMHKAMQYRDPSFLDALKQEINKQPNGPWFTTAKDTLTKKAGYYLAEIALSNLPAANETGNTEAVKKPSAVAAAIQKLFLAHPEFIIRAFALSEITLTERSVAAATAALAAHYDADAILTTHNYSVRAMTPDVLTMLPKRLQEKAKKAASTMITITPDNGYTKRKPDGSEETGLTKQEQLDDMAICEPHAFVTRPFAPWLANTLHIVADDRVADRMSYYWQVPKEQYYAFGTVADTLSPSEFQEKWNTPERRILIASNGNGSNIQDAIKAIKEIGNVSKTWLSDNALHLDIFCANFPEYIPDIRLAAREAGMEDQIEVIDYTHDFFDTKTVFSYSNDPTIRIHIAFGTKDVPGSDLKQFMQRAAHIEIRSPGENALTGAKVGTLELGTPPGAPNEIYNMAWAARNGLSYPINWTADETAKPWQKAGMSTQHGLIPDEKTKTFPLLITSILENGMADRLARTAYNTVNKQTNYAIIGLLTTELMRKNAIRVPDRATVKQLLTEYMEKRNAASVITPPTP